MTATERRIFEPDGRAIPYVDEGSGPALVLIPGMGLDIAYLSTLASVLAEADLRLVRVGSRGADGTAATLHDFAQDVVDVMDHLGIVDAWIGGHAFGGVVARTVALDHPDHVNGVLLLGVEGPEATSDEGAGVPGDAQLEAMQRAALASTPDVEWSSLAPNVPVLVVQGSDDPVTPPAGGERLQASAPGLVSLVQVDGAGHLFPATHAGETAWVIEDYLDWD